MERIALLGNIAAENRIIENGVIIVSDNIIEYAGERKGVALPPEARDYGGRLLAPGFVDIHCHAGNGYFVNEEPELAAGFHLRYGTTSMLCSLYRDIDFNGTLRALEKIKSAMRKSPHILGVHMEGPYLSPLYGAKAGGGAVSVNPEQYRAIISSGIIKQWTFSPEIEGIGVFLRDIVAAGIVPSIGHSEASPEQVYAAEGAGARIVTHLTDATGCSVSPSRFAGTKEMSFDSAAMLCDNLYYEIILDKDGVHVRHDMAKLIIKTVGIDKVIGITDNCGDDTQAAGEKTSDVNMANGELMGSRLTMDNVARNFLSLGLSVPDVFKVVSLNPAKAIRTDKVTGSLEKGKRADILLTDKNLSSVEVLDLRSAEALGLRREPA